MGARGADAGIDVGGTFTDFVSREGRVVKVPSDRSAPGGVIESGLAELLATGRRRDRALLVAHGTTVATNALLTGALAPTGVLLTAGFRDLLALGRQSRPRLYDLHPRPAWQPPAREACAEVCERIGADGRVITPLDVDGLLRGARRLVARGAEAVAICFLHSYRNPRHERAAKRALGDLGVPVCASSELVPEFREFERFSTAFANAGLMPLLAGYVGDLEARFDAIRRLSRSRRRPTFVVMQSDGGTMALARAAREPVRLTLSGPAGGLVGAWAAASSRERRRLVTLDMGGTSTDVALLEGGEPVVSRCEVAGRPLILPVLDIHTVGAGGGSIARRDSGGGLRVGPESAGADPGPACYGRGGPATVTDANVFLGRIPPGHFLGGRFTLDERAAERAVVGLAKQLALSAEDCALGIVRIAEATMERALRRISLERGHDPRRFSLVAFGGAGALHAAALCEGLQMTEVVVPPDPGLLSARGMLHARAKKERSMTLLGASLDALERDPEHAFGRLEADGLRALRREGLDDDDVRIARWVDLRYAGQSYELTVPLGPPGRTEDAFRRAHHRRYGFVMSDRPVEVVAVRARLGGPAPRRRRPIVAASRARPRPIGRTSAGFPGGRCPAPLLAREELPAGGWRRGPAVIVEYSATTVVPPAFSYRVEPGGCLILRSRRS